MNCVRLVVLASMRTNTLIETNAPVRGASARPIVQRLTTTRRRMIIELYELGLSARVVAAQTNVSKTAVLSTLKQAGVAMRPRGSRW
jgi:DNA-binding NarL/FixJ family response regulator